ncbi:hypothetical protein BCR34DRAFT_112415 [Clohesyomyces aquaticus]|uniref:Uncharacterized protein n=1 Tax=Clohesyomyces aquaticus TaxID=1231657 RepID=A0A1Y1YR57_9PLEO|nr:hypothetical protein BCR34DRAFT_112415 [Clohesyomyces aquaticus]
MEKSRVNLAVTQDGTSYNKLKRPDDYVAGLARKRPEPEANENLSEEEPQPKRAKQNGSSKRRAAVVDPKEVRVPVDPECGMRFGLPVQDDGYSSDETTNEALAYLRNVRSEAQSIPNVLLAPKALDEAIYNDCVGDMRAYYKDGTWMALDPNPDDDFYASESDSVVDPRPQEQYNKLLLMRYQSLRKKLAQAASADSFKRKSSDATKSPDEHPPRGRHAWLYVLSRQFPTFTQVSRMNQRHVFQGLLYAMHSLDRYDTITKEQSCWLWVLLAKAGEPGTLNYKNVGGLRELAQKAQTLQIRLRDGYLKGQDHYTSDEYDSTGSEMEEDGEMDSEDEETGCCGVLAENDMKVGNGPESEFDTSVLDSEGGLSRDNDPPQDDISEKPSEAPAKQNPKPTEDKEPATLEEARARLLAQLGDRLVQPKVYLSRLEAEEQRQRMRDQQLAIAQGDDFPKPEAKTAQQDRGKDNKSEALVADASKRTEAGEQTHTKPTPRCQESPSSAKMHSPLATDPHEPDMDEMGTETPARDANTRATLDMIITVVAECYGQKDLLGYRDAWA